MLTDYCYFWRVLPVIEGGKNGEKTLCGFLFFGLKKLCNEFLNLISVKLQHTAKGSQSH